MRQVSKLEAARRQIDAAIRMLFNEEDNLAVHTLAWAAHCVVRDVAKATGKANLLSDFFERHLDSHYRELANFLKHADRDPNEAIVEFADDVPDMLLEMASTIFVGLGEKQTAEMIALIEIRDLKHKRYMDHDELRREERKEEDLEERERDEERRLEDLIDECANEPEEAELYQMRLADLHRDQHRRMQIKHGVYMEMGRRILNTPGGSPTPSAESPMPPWLKGSPSPA